MAAVAAPYNWPGITNPVANITEFNSELTTTNLLGSAYVEYELIDNLVYRASGNVNLNANRRNAYRTSAIVLNQLLPPQLTSWPCVFRPGSQLAFQSNGEL